ncbi:MAG: DNA-binding protein [Acetilactobacillus jinshanensis]
MNERVLPLDTNSILRNILGRVVPGKVTDQNDKNYYVQIDGITFELNKAEIKKPMHNGSQFKGFTYVNVSHKLQITRQVPNVQVDHYDFGTVVSSKYDLGVFVDIGLPNKDIAVSKDELPLIHSLWPKRGDKLMISLITDKKHRIWGHLADEDIYRTIALPGDQQMMNNNVKAVVFRVMKAGTKVMTNHFHLGFIHPTQRDVEPRLGEQIKARVIGIHHDGTFNFSMRPRAYEAIDGDALMLLAMLQHDPTHHLNFTDKSDPEKIKTFFGISKGRFKRGVGHLLKNDLIKETDQGLDVTSKGHAT